MITIVGKQISFIDAMKDLLELEYDSIKAYTAAITKLDNLEHKSKLLKFREDHEHHIQDITEVLEQNNNNTPRGPSGKQLLLVGSIVIEGLIGDKAILNAMLSAEEDTVRAYERMNSYAGMDNMSTQAINRGLEDEKRHREWVKSTIKSYK